MAGNKAEIMDIGKAYEANFELREVYWQEHVQDRKTKHVWVKHENDEGRSYWKGLVAKERELCRADLMARYGVPTAPNTECSNCPVYKKDVGDPSCRIAVREGRCVSLPRNVRKD